MGFLSCRIFAEEKRVAVYNSSDTYMSVMTKWRIKKEQPVYTDCSFSSGVGRGDVEIFHR